MGAFHYAKDSGNFGWNSNGKVRSVSVSSDRNILDHLWCWSTYFGRNSFEEALQEGAEIEKRLDEYKEKAKQDMEKALKWCDAEAIKKADCNWWIVTSIVKDLRETNPNFVEPSQIDQLICGKEEEKRRKSAQEAHERRLDRLWRQLRDMYPNQKGKGSKAPRQKPRCWIQE